MDEIAEVDLEVENFTNKNNKLETKQTEFEDYHLALNTIVRESNVTNEIESKDEILIDDLKIPPTSSLFAEKSFENQIIDNKDELKYPIKNITVQQNKDMDFKFDNEDLLNTVTAIKSCTDIFREEIVKANSSGEIPKSSEGTVLKDNVQDDCLSQKAECPVGNLSNVPEYATFINLSSMLTDFGYLKSTTNTEYSQVSSEKESVDNKIAQNTESIKYEVPDPTEINESIEKDLRAGVLGLSESTITFGKDLFRYKMNKVCNKEENANKVEETLLDKNPELKESQPDTDTLPKHRSFSRRKE